MNIESECLFCDINMRASKSKEYSTNLGLKVHFPHSHPNDDQFEMNGTFSTIRVTPQVDYNEKWPRIPANAMLLLFVVHHSMCLSSYSEQFVGKFSSAFEISSLFCHDTVPGKHSCPYSRFQLILKKQMALIILIRTRR